jgi:hypothetical protein
MGETLTDAEFEEEEREKQTQSTLPLPVGFDRLRSAGFSDDDIASLRAQFQRFHGSRGDEDDSVDVTAMEERWLDDTIGLGGGGNVVDGGNPPGLGVADLQRRMIHTKRLCLDFSSDTLRYSRLGTSTNFLGIVCVILHLGTGDGYLKESKTGDHCRGTISSLTY